MRRRLLRHSFGVPLGVPQSQFASRPDRKGGSQSREHRKKTKRVKTHTTLRPPYLPPHVSRGGRVGTPPGGEITTSERTVTPTTVPNPDHLRRSRRVIYTLSSRIHSPETTGTSTSPPSLDQGRDVLEYDEYDPCLHTGVLTLTYPLVNPAVLWDYSLDPGTGTTVDPRTYPGRSQETGTDRPISSRRRRRRRRRRRSRRDDDRPEETVRSVYTHTRSRMR